MVPEGDFNFTRRSTGSLESAVALYLWFALCVCALAFDQARFSIVNPPAAASFVIPLLAFASFLVLYYSRVASALLVVGFATTVLFLVFSSALGVALSPTSQTALLVLSFAPLVWLRLWHWKWHAVLFSFIGLALTAQWLALFGWRGCSLVPVYFVFASGLVVISRIELGRHNQHNISDNSRSNSIQLLHHAWPMTAFQAGILLTLSFSEVVLSSSSSSSGTQAHFYSLACLLLGALLLIMVNESKRQYVLLSVTSAIALVLTIGTISQKSEPLSQLEVFLSMLCLVMLHVSTLSIPWGLRNSLLLAWIFTGFGVLSAVLALPTSIEIAPIIGVLVSGVSASLVASRAFENRRGRVRSRVSLEATSGIGGERSEGLQRLTALRTLAREGIAARRFDVLLPTLFVAGVFATVLSLSLTKGFSVLHLGFASFYVLWGSIFYLSRRRSGQEPLWFVAALSALLIFLWTCALIALSQTRDPIWLLLPASVLVVCGLIPWKTIEIFPLLVASVVIGTVTSFQVGEYRYGLFFVAIAILTWYLSANIHRKIRERFLLQEFQQGLRSARSIDETLYTLADYLGTLFGDVSVLISRGVSLLDLVGDGFVYSVKERSFDVNRVAPRILSISALEKFVRIGVSNWIEEELRIELGELGSFVANHAVVIEIEVLRDAKAVAESGRVSGDGHVEAVECVRLIVPSEFPVFQFIIGDELYLAEALAGEALLRLRSFAEEGMRRRAEAAAFTIQADRDYELSSLVHDINNTVQDQALLCDGVIEDLDRAIQLQGGTKTSDASEVLRDAVSRVRRIAVSSRAMAAVVSDAKRKRELDRIEDLHPRELIEVQQVVSEAFEFALVRSERRRVVIRREGTEEKPLNVRVSSRDHLETALRSLLNNAIAVSNPGSDVTIRVRCSAEWVWVDVQDTGPGLSPEERRALLRGDSVRHWGGSDLGFSQLRRFCEAQGGSLDVSSIGAGTGSVFTLLLPRLHIESQVGHQAWALVVDDEASLVQSYARIIKALHLEPVIASSITEARRCIDGRTKPSLLITDLNLGEESGFELIRYVRERYGISLPILVVSGVDDEQILHKLVTEEHCAAVTKPVGQRVLFAKLEELLAQTRMGIIG